MRYQVKKTLGSKMVMNLVYQDHSADPNSAFPARGNTVDLTECSMIHPFRKLSQ